MEKSFQTVFYRAIFEASDVDTDMCKLLSLVYDV